ncbi:APC family permease [Rhodohalobacter sp. 614A]|uniref:APC family permease n=1 Tax=Rhodohalobacter sp. 614A TaxID=2908649 RepID=UPI001F30B6F2|nr:amino acid permease [Rhodohalobacter sp. 614A]
MKASLQENTPIQGFTTLSSIAVMVGIVVGIGIFRLPPIVASNSANEFQFISFWIAGGFISLMGALCYAELASSKPDAGGEYHFLSRAFGPPIGFLFTWGRMTVIQTGSLALIAFILGDYAALILDIGPHSSAVYAALTIIILTGLNLFGTTPSRRIQNLLTGLIIVMMILLSLSGLISAESLPELSESNTNSGWSLFSGGSAGAAMIFVLLTYGGWNEAAYLSGELQDVKRNMMKVLLFGILIITFIYVLINSAYLRVLGLESLQNSETVGADLANQIFGPEGTIIVTFIVVATALSTANATIITGARTNYALGRDFSLLSFLGKWNSKNNTPVNALIVQGVIALLLVGLGAWSQEAVTTMVDYTAPVFWLFLLLTTATLFIFRFRQGKKELPFRVPLYPLTPILFLIACGYMLYSSLAFTGSGALVGVAILAVGVPVYLLARNREG